MGRLGRNIYILTGNSTEAASADRHEHLVKKVARGAAALTVRQILTYSANVTGGILLARFLAPADFGFYAVVSLFLAFLNIFGGTGLAGNLIRSGEPPTLNTYRTVFTAQQIVVASVAVGVWIAAPWVSSLYHLQLHGTQFFRMAAVSLVLTSLMVIPQVKMERELSFDRLAIIEVAQAVLFNVVAITMAWRHFGILAFAAGLVTRSLVGAILANIISPWAVGLRWDPARLKSHMIYGVTLQSGQILAMLKDSITPLFVGLFLGATQMGYATWANVFAGYPAVILIPMQRLYLPFFAKLQNDSEALLRFVPKVLWFVNMVSAPVAVLSVALAHPITTLIFGDKWLSALPIFYCFAVANITMPTSTPLMGLLNALGKPQTTVWIIAFAMIGTWVLGVPLIMVFGVFGFGLATIGVSAVNFLLYWWIWKATRILPWGSFWPSWPLSIVLGAAAYALLRIIPVHSILALAAYFLIAMSVYAGTLWFVFPLTTRA